MTDEKDILPVQPAAEDASAAEVVTDSAERVTEAVGDAAEELNAATDTVIETAGAVAEAAEETADKAQTEIAETADDVKDEISEATDQAEEAAGKPTEESPADRFSSIISAAEHSAEMTSQKTSKDEDIYFKMPGEESEAENGEEEESQDTASASIPEETPVIVFENVHK